MATTMPRASLDAHYLGHFIGATESPHESPASILVRCADIRAAWELDKRTPFDARATCSLCSPQTP